MGEDVELRHTSQEKLCEWRNVDGSYYVCRSMASAIVVVLMLNGFAWYKNILR